MSKKIIIIAGIMMGVLGFVLPSNSAAVQYNFPLDGSQEVPQVVTPGTGVGQVTLNTNTLSLGWNISYANLTGPATGIHFHGPAPIGANAGVQVNIGNISGLVSPTIGSTFITAAQSADVQNGLWYVNVHTQQFPGGEIRGQVVPEPATLLLFGLGSLALYKKRRVS